jgi:hypothetical protein
LYQYKTHEIVPAQPFAQFQFNPNPTLAITEPLGLNLSADTPGSKAFSSACYQDSCKYLERNIELHSVSDTLTSLQLSSLRTLTPDQLAELSGMLPNLVSLDVSSCDNVLSDLSGLAAVSTNCSKLKVLKLFGNEMAESSEKLWGVLATMANLRFLSVPSSLIPERLEPPIPTPSLTGVKICGEDSHHTVEPILAFLAQISSLKMFRFECVPPVTVVHGFSKLLRATDLTHLYISKKPGNTLTLPTDPSCYVNLEQLYLDCEDFVFEDDLASALAKSEKLIRLVLNVSSLVDIKGITDIAASSKLLSVFRVSVSSNRGTTATWSKKTAERFTKRVMETAKEEGRGLDFSLKVKSLFLKEPEFVW